MRTRREQVEAYRFVTQRIVSAMTAAKPDTLEFPMRRTTLSVLGGGALALLAFAGFWVVGMLFPAGNAAWKQEGSIIVDSASGAVYAYISGALFPVDNLASARLLFTSDDVPVHEVSTQDLSGEPRAWEIGIPGAPKTLPATGSLVTTPWQVCSAPAPDNPSRRDSHVVLAESAADAKLGATALLVATEDEDRFLLWNNRKLAVPEDSALLALGFQPDKAVPVSKVFVNAIDTGPELAAFDIDKAGDKADELDADYGDLFASGGRNYVLTVDGLAPLGDTGYALLRDGAEADPASLSASELSEIGTAELEPEGFPDKIPAVHDAAEDSVVCAVYDGDGVTLALYPDPPTPITSPSVYAPATELDTVDTADHVWLPGGGGAVVRAQASPSAADGTVYLITDMGRKFAMPPEALKSLGYQDWEPNAVPASFVALVPTGPALDPEVVRQQIA